MKNLNIFTKSGEKCRLIDCPIGLFICENSIGFRSEMIDEEDFVAVSDYTGEIIWGEIIPITLETIVQPISITKFNHRPSEIFNETEGEVAKNYFYLCEECRRQFVLGKSFDDDDEEIVCNCGKSNHTLTFLGDNEREASENLMDILDVDDEDIAEAMGLIESDADEDDLEESDYDLIEDEEESDYEEDDYEDSDYDEISDDEIMRFALRNEVLAFVHSSSEYDASKVTSEDVESVVNELLEDEEFAGFIIRAIETKLSKIQI